MKEKNESTAIITPEIGIITPKIGIITPEIGIIIPAGINNIIDNVKSFSNFTLNEKTGEVINKKTGEVECIFGGNPTQKENDSLEVLEETDSLASGFSIQTDTIVFGGEKE